MKLPQGYGSVYKLKGKRRRPWIAVKTVGWELVDGKAKQKRVIVGYFPTKADGLSALASFADLTEKCTFSEVYERWSKQAFPKLSSTTHYESAYRFLKKLWKKKFADLKTQDLESAVMTLPNITAKKTSKMLLNQMYKYALKYDLCSANYAERFSVDNEPPKIERKPFTDEEIEMLWNDHDGGLILIQIYSGWRASELVSFTDDGEYMYGGVKSDWGRNRVVPIHPIIKDLVKNRKQITLGGYRAQFLRVMNRLGLDHATHDCRVTFATKCHLYGVDFLAEQKMMGHKPDTITEAVYTKLSKEYLRDELLKIVK